MSEKKIATAHEPLIHLSKRESISPVKSWLIRIAVRTCMDMQRSPWQRWVNRRVTPEMLPERPADAEPADAALTLAVMKLPRREREAVILYYYQDLTMQETVMRWG